MLSTKEMMTTMMPGRLARRCGLLEARKVSARPAAIVEVFVIIII